MLRRFSAAFFAALICSSSGVTSLTAVADDRGDEVSVGAENGELKGALKTKDAGKSKKKDKNLDAKPPSTPPPYYKPSECVRRVGAGAAVDCEREDRPEVPGVERVFVPPSEAEVRVALRLPDPTPRFGPDPEVNEWKMLVVGYPVWLWTDAPTRLSATATHDGLSMTLRAEWVSTRFEMGDGHSRTCTATTVYPKRPDRYGMPSPTCGYTYQKRSKPGRDYTVTATTHWRVSWFTGGHSGTLMTSYAGQRSLPIGELQALIKG